MRGIETELQCGFSYWQTVIMFPWQLSLSVFSQPGLLLREANGK